MSDAVREASERLIPLHFLLGTWQGAGTSHGAAITARLVVRPCLQGSFLEAREQITQAGALEHEDICFYRYDAHQQQLRVQQLSAPAWIEEFLVIQDALGKIRWYNGPDGPAVRIEQRGDDLVVSVTLAGSCVVQVRYHRVDA